MDIRKIDIKKLEAAHYNPRADLQPGDEEYEKLKKSIDEFGYVDPIIWNEKTGRVVGGHQRLKVLKDLGHKEVTVSVVNMDEEKEKALNVALNKIEGEWDYRKLGELLFDLDEDLQELTGFDDWEIEDIYTQFDISEDQMTEVEDDDFDLDDGLEGAMKTSIRPGDIIELGPHKLICGDSTKPEIYEKLMGGCLADMTITDPPYNVNYEEKDKMLLQFRDNKRVREGKNIQIENDSMSNDNFYKFLLDAFTNTFNITKNGGGIYVFHADTYGDIFRTAYKDAGYKLAQVLVWVKNSLVIGRQDYHWRHEPILYGWKEGAAHIWNSDRKQDTVQDWSQDLYDLTKDELIDLIEDLREESTVVYNDRPSRSSMHPTMKPVPLIGYLMKNNSRRDDIILDPFGGSGSTMIAADQLGRKCYLIELDPVYCQVIVDRYKAHQPNASIKINGKMI